MWTPRPPRGAWGQLKLERVAAPAAGKDWAWVAPAGYVTRIVSGRALLTLSAQVANRRLGIQMVNGSDVFWRAHAGETDVAAAVIDVNVGQGASFVGPGQQTKSIEWELPELLLPAGWSVELTTEAIQTEDAWSDIVLLTEQFEDCPDHDEYYVHHMLHELAEIRGALTRHA